jgi:N-acetylglucosamine-6-phosphate deacetylase
MKLPGFVDIQVNGYMGKSYSSDSLTAEDVKETMDLLRARGTSVFLPTIVTSPVEVFERNLSLIGGMIRRGDLGAHVPGIHVEGPFISPEDGARGAHNRDWVRKPDPALFDKMWDWSEGTIKILTIAAEVEGSDTLCRHAVERGVTVSLGHQMASDEDLHRLVDAGAGMITHLGNGIPQTIDRHHNALFSGIANDRLSASVIADSHHVPEALLKTILRGKTVSRCAVVSDASPIAGFPAGTYPALNQDAVLAPSGRLYNPETGYLVGSSATMMMCANHLAAVGFVSRDEIIELCYRNPLALIRMKPSDVDLPNAVEYRDGSFHMIEGVWQSS